MSQNRTPPGFDEEDVGLDPSEDPFACMPEHDAYIRREVADTLARKKRREISYVSLDEAIRKFLPDAR